MKLKPLGDRLIVKAVEEEATTASGIVLPDNVRATGDAPRHNKQRAEIAIASLWFVCLHLSSTKGGRTNSR